MIIAVISLHKKLLESIHGYLTIPQPSHPFFNNIDDNCPHKILSINRDIQDILAVCEQEHPDLLLFEGSLDTQEELEFMGRVTARYPVLGVIMLCSDQTPEKLIQAMRVGVREALPSQPSREVVLDAVDRFQQRINQANTPANKCQIMSFIPCKGGSGATFLATNLAYALAAGGDKRVGIIDFNLQLGDAVLFLTDTTPTSSIADVTRQIHRLDSEFLMSSMIKILPNLSILASPNEPEKATEILPEHIAPLIQVATKIFDFLILDIGRRMDSVSIEVLDKTDLIFPVVQQSLPFIRDAKVLINAFRSLGYQEENIRLIINRYDKRSEISLKDITNILKIPVFRTIPNNYLVVEESVNHGVPIIKLSKRSEVAKVLIKMASEMDVDGTKKGWFKKLF